MPNKLWLFILVAAALACVTGVTHAQCAPGQQWNPQPDGAGGVINQCIGAPGQASTTTTIPVLGAGPATTTTFVTPPAVFPNANSQYNGLMNAFQQKASSWGPQLQDITTRLFELLVIIGFVIKFAPLLLRGADIGELVAALFEFLFGAGVWLYFISNYTNYAQIIINSAGQAASQASGNSAASQVLNSLGSTSGPWTVIDTGVHLAWNMMKSITGTAIIASPIPIIGAIFSGIFTVIIFGLTAALYAMTKIESYVVINAAVIFMGLGAFEFTSDYAKNAIRYAIGIAVKLYTLQLILAVTIQVTQTWISGFSGELSDITQLLFGLVALEIIVALLCIYVPARMSALVMQEAGMGLGAVPGMVASAGKIALGAASLGLAALSAAQGVSALAGAAGGGGGAEASGGGEGSGSSNGSGSGPSSGGAPKGGGGKGKAAPPSMGQLLGRQAAATALSRIARGGGFAGALAQFGADANATASQLNPPEAPSKEKERD